MGDGDFWDSQDAAQKVISEYRLLKAQTEGLGEIITEFDDATVGYELAKEAGDEELLTEVDGGLHALVKKMERVELQSLLSGPHDHRNCFVTI